MRGLRAQRGRIAAQLLLRLLLAFFYLLRMLLGVMLSVVLQVVEIAHVAALSWPPRARPWPAAAAWISRLPRGASPTHALRNAPAGNGRSRAGWPVPSPEVDDVQIKMVLYLPRDAASVPVGRQVLDGCLQTLGVTADTRSDIALALSEACANVIQHAGPGDEYEVTARTTDGRCIIEVVNGCHGAADGDHAAAGPDGDGAGITVPADVLTHPTAEHGRGLKIMDAVVDDLRLTGNGREGTTVHMEKILDWVPDAAGEHLFRRS